MSRVGSGQLKVTYVQLWMGSKVRVSESTHELGRLLDFVATRRDLTPPNVGVVDVGLSDHYLQQWSVTSANSTPLYTILSSDDRGARSTSLTSGPHCRRLPSVSPTSGEVWTSTQCRCSTTPR